MPVIRADILKGRSQAQKARFAAGVTEAAVEALGVRPEQVRVLINEVEPEHWFVAGAAKSPPS